ncbi:MAG: energy transducer TonB [Spartobacteria bacterium]
MTEPKRDRRKVWWAVLASLLLHLCLGLSLAAFGGGKREAVLEDEAPPQLTIMNLDEPTPPPLVPKNAPMTTIDPARKSAVKPKEKTFEANEDSIAASETAPTEKESVLPSQEGKDRPIVNLEEHENSFANAGSTPQPTPTPVATPPPEKEPTPNETVPPTAPTPAPDQLALLTQTPTPVSSPLQTEEKTEIPSPKATPTPTVEPTSTPPKPASAYRDFQQKTRIRGGISNRGTAAVNAVGTPLGRYVKLLQDALGARWYYLMEANSDLKSVGTTELRFEVAPDGQVEGLRVVSNTSSEACASIAIRSVQETKFPPLPDDLVATLPNGRLTMEQMTFAIYPNR